MYINEIAFHKGIRNEEPNKYLAKTIIETSNKEAIKEISSYLNDKNKSIASDCIAVLYHVGYEKPELIAYLYDDFYSYFRSKNNRMVWGAMIAISTIAKVEPHTVYRDRDKVISLIKDGSVITQVWGVYTLINLCNVKEYNKELIDVLLDVLDKTRDIDFAKRAISIHAVISTESQDRFNSILMKRVTDLSKSAQIKVKKLIDTSN